MQRKTLWLIITLKPANGREGCFPCNRAYAPNSSEYQGFLYSLGEVLESALSGYSVILLGDLIFMFMWSMTARPGGSCLGVVFCYWTSVWIRLSITNTMLEYQGVHKCTWHQDTLGYRSMNNFVIVSGSAAVCSLNTWMKSHAVKWLPPAGELDQVAGQDAGQTWHTWKYCEVVLGMPGIGPGP